jgi:hypothetical protein
MQSGGPARAPARRRTCAGSCREGPRKLQRCAASRYHALASAALRGQRLERSHVGSQVFSSPDCRAADPRPRCGPRTIDPIFRSPMVSRIACQQRRWRAGEAGTAFRLIEAGVVARGGIEPPTRGFSVLFIEPRPCSTWLRTTTPFGGQCRVLRAYRV